MLIRIFIFLLVAAAPCGGWAAEAAADPIVLLKKLIIADSEAKALAVPQDSGGAATVFVQDVAVLDAGFITSAEKFVGKPISPESLAGLETLIMKYSKEHDRLIVRVTAPVQDASKGVVRLAVVVGRYNDLQFRGNRWFSSKLLQEKLGVKSGDEVRLSTLEEAVRWANANPFRQIQVLINDLTTQNQPGKADLLIGVVDRLPFRFTASYDDYGNDALGNNHYTAALQFGNLWGRDHQGAYQYTTTDDTHRFQSHALSYQVPLSWRHTLQLSAGYLVVNPDYGSDNVFTQRGENLILSARYVVPLNTGTNSMEFTTGVDFKQGNNSLAYNNIPQITATNDTFQLTLGLSKVRRDKHGAWLFAANVNASPGNINKRNTNRSFMATDASKPITATYLTGNFSVQRLLNIGNDWSLFSRAVVQVASGSLPGGEQMSIGGSSTVRGFDERVFAGDRGFVFTNDLQTPAIKTTLPFSKKTPPLETRFIAFYDAAQVFYKFQHLEGRDDPPLRPLASTGLGIRMTMSPNFSLTADYGWQRTEFLANANSSTKFADRLAYRTTDRSRGHIKVVLAF